MSLDREQFIDGYLAEVDEHLRAANGALLAVDQRTTAGAPAAGTHRHVRTLFRALHTIKGLSAMVGVEPIVEIAHEMESILRDADRTTGQLSRVAVDVLVDGVRAIEQRVALFGARKTVPAAPRALLSALTDLREPDRRTTRAAPPKLRLDADIVAKIAPLDQQMLVDGVVSGRRAVRIDFIPTPALAARDINITTVRQRVGAIADIVKVLPLSVPQSAAAPAALCFALVLLTDATDAELLAAAVSEPSGLHRIELDDNDAEALDRSASAKAGVATSGGGGSASADPRVDVEQALGDDDALDDDNERDDVRSGFGAASIRVDVQRLDDALEKLSALVVTRFRLARAISALRERGVDVRDLATIASDSARELADLRGSIIHARMVSVTELLERVPLIVRGMTRNTNKVVRVMIHAERAELDKAVADRVFPAIVHLVRNAVDHAIEPSDERVRLGKPAEGTVTVSAIAHSESQLELTVADDGRGVDAARVAARAGRNAPAPNDFVTLLELLCMPGLSTLDRATSNSGRGMGMDIVKKIAVDALGGELAMTTSFGVGTRFTLRVPLSISICDSFSFECASQAFVVPVSTIEEIVEIAPENVFTPPTGRPTTTDAAPASNARDGADTTERGMRMLRRRGEVLPLLSLAGVLKLAPGGQGAATHRVPPKALVVRRQGMPFAFAVDRMLGQHEIVVRPIDDPLVSVPGVSGTTDLGDGKPVLVLDLSGLVHALSRAGAQQHVDVSKEAS